MINKVMIGCPVRNRAWILPRYLEHISRLEYPRDKLEYCFIINNCTDDTRQILEDFARKQSIPVKLVIADFQDKAGHTRGNYSFNRLAWLRNILLSEFLKSSCGFLFSVDSDILVPPDVLSKLIEDECEIISALVCNGHQVGDKQIFNILNKSKDGTFIHLKEFPRDRTFQVDCTGAAYLIKRKMIEDMGIRYSAEFGAEDIGFCEAAREKGIKIYCDGRLECIHVMDSN